MGLLSFSRNDFSQNGEDGILEEILRRIGEGARSCCEFGAWDGIHFSNTRRLLLRGWRGVMIEGEPQRFRQLVETYAGNERVTCINRFVDSGKNSLSALGREFGCADTMGGLDVLSVDIDGLDYEIFESLDIAPRVICIEVGAGHSPFDDRPIPQVTARANVGQPLRRFTALAQSKGYSLVCYSGNAFYVRSDCIGSLEPRTDQDAYREFLDHLSTAEREWLLLANLGLVPPFYRYRNPLLRQGDLHVSSGRAAVLVAKALPHLATRALSSLRSLLDKEEA